jgi:hypothetical protein
VAVSAADAGVVRGGPKTPVHATPSRAQASVRRTTSIDSARPDGWAGSVLVTARARDLRTPRDGAPVERDGVAFRARLSAQRVLEAIEHPDAGLARLIGASVAGGFRARALGLFPEEAARGSLLNLLLDDLPGASLVAGYAMQRDPAWPAHRVALEHVAGMDDLCAGWAREATILQVVRAEAVIPVPTTAPVAPPSDDDPLAWHALDELPVGGMRRARRLDVVADDPTHETLRFDVHFRDSYRDANEGEGAVHEYVVHGRFAPRTRIIVALEAAAPVLPWTECPRALGSASRLVGTTTDDLRARVRADFTGTSTCTHLNDVLRSLADLPVLAAALRDDPSG